MYSTTISPRPSIKSDGQLHGSPPVASPPKPVKNPPPPTRRPALPLNISTEQILIAVIGYLLLQSDSPDWLLILALVYILF